MKRKEKNEGLTLNGWNKFFHRLFLFVTFPIRRPLIFIPLIIVAYLAPTFMGVRPAEVHLWYWNKIKKQTTGISSAISEKTQAIKPIVDNINISMPDIETFRPQQKPREQMVEVPRTKPQNIRRQTFEKAKAATGTIDVLKTARKQQESFSPQKPQIREIQIEKPQIQKDSDTVINKQDSIINKPAVVTKKPDTVINKLDTITNKPDTIMKKPDVLKRKTDEQKKKLPLVFVENGETITGQATVHNANEINLYGKTYFLHGIYVNPNSDKGIEGKNFLRNTIAQNVIDCTIKAFTYQGIGTVVCTVNGENINRLMVKRGYSKNVALD